MVIFFENTSGHDAEQVNIVIYSLATPDNGVTIVIRVTNTLSETLTRKRIHKDRNPFFPFYISFNHIILVPQQAFKMQLNNLISIDHTGRNCSELTLKGDGPTVLRALSVDLHLSIASNIQ